MRQHEHDWSYQISAYISVIYIMRKCKECKIEEEKNISPDDFKPIGKVYLKASTYGSAGSGKEEVAVKQFAEKSHCAYGGVHHLNNTWICTNCSKRFTEEEANKL